MHFVPCNLGVKTVKNSFYADIKNAKLSEDGRVLRFPNGMPPGGRREFPEEIFIRQAYEDFYAVIKNKRKRCIYFVVTGTPGIGKSIFVLYCMWRYLNEGENSEFVYETTSNTFELYRNGSEERHASQVT